METLLLLGAGAGIAALVLGTKKKTPQQKFIDTATPIEKKIMKEEVERVEKLIENKQKVVHAIQQKEAKKWNSRDPDGPLSSDECRQVKTILAKGQCIVSKDPGADTVAVVGWDAPQKRIDRELRTHGWTSHGEFIMDDFGDLRTKRWMCPPGKKPILTPPKWSSSNPHGPLNSQERQEVKNILAKGQCIVSEDPGAPRLAVVGWDARQKRIDRELRSHGWTSHSEPVSFGGGATPISFMQKVWMCPPGKWKRGKGK